MPSLSHLGTFLSESLRNFRQTGSVAPSSKALGRAMLRWLPRDRPTRVLEVGAGSGAFTRTIVSAVADRSAIDVVEINPKFAERLEAVVAEIAPADMGERRVSIHCQDIRNFRPDAPFDSIICSLPFNNFPPALVEEMISAMLGQLKPSGDFIYFEYLFLRTVLSCSPTSEARRRRAVGAVLAEFNQGHRVGREIVLRNFPPALVTQLRP